MNVPTMQNIEGFSTAHARHLHRYKYSKHLTAGHLKLEHNITCSCTRLLFKLTWSKIHAQYTFLFMYPENLFRAENGRTNKLILDVPSLLKW